MPQCNAGAAHLLFDGKGCKSQGANLGTGFSSPLACLQAAAARSACSDAERGLFLITFRRMPEGQIESEGSTGKAWMRCVLRYLLQIDTGPQRSPLAFSEIVKKKALGPSGLSCGRQRTTRHGGADAAPRRGRWQITRTPTGRSMLCSEAPAPRRQLACHRQCQFRQDYQPSCQQRSRIQSCRRHHQSCRLPRLTARHLAHHTKASWLSLTLAQSAKAGTTEMATTT